MEEFGDNKTRREGSRTDANAADELSCSPSAPCEFDSSAGSSNSSANRLAARPCAGLVGVFGAGSAALLA